MGLFKKIFGNTRKPEGVLGKMMVSGMNSGHAKVSDWGMDHLKDIDPSNIADLGCGGGRNAEQLLKRYPKARITALDYSEVSVEAAKKRNGKAIAEGRCKVVQGDVSELRFENESFDLVTAFETIYFWPGPQKSFREVCRVLKKGGRFLIVNESDGLDKSSQKWASIIDGMSLYDKDKLDTLLRESGFSKVTAYVDSDVHRLCIIAEK